MKSFILRLSGLEIAHLLRAETDAANGQPELNTTCEKDYITEEDFADNAHDVHNGEQFDLVTSIAVLTIEPRVESGYWTLSVTVERALGLIQPSNEGEMSPTELTLDEFVGELRSARQKEVTVRLDVPTPAIKQDFDWWLSDMRARHPWKRSRDEIAKLSR